ncbi:M23 family metallopeptidase [Streptomyces sp. G-G2]|uniref:M23 family metallopeptidase n=1 Tax=Streptomyces sp. G-G2 TaxID=3046201 RepID=UPI0024BBD799|nr:M23 family metallopeptidase [Streptomyces sp. G-G2]MDJ0383385.1 M23 family metallopeptidase [Streptomyces sp. G-G2]
MNDSPTSGQYPENGYDGLSTTTFAGDVSYAPFETQGQGYAYGAYASSYETGAYDSSAWNTPAQDGYLTGIPAQAAAEDTTGQWDSSAWNTGTAPYQPAAFGHDTGSPSGQWAMPGYGTAGTESGAYDATAWNSVAQEELPQQFQPEAAHQDGYAHEATATYETVTAGGYDTSAYEAPYDTTTYDTTAYENTTYENATYDTTAYDNAGYEAPHEPATDPDGTGSSSGPAEFDSEPAEFDAGSGPAGSGPATAVFEAIQDMPTQTMTTTPPVPRSARRAAPAKGGTGGAGSTGSAGSASAGGASRRRSPAKRSALLTVAVPSVCVIGVAGVAAAAVGGLPSGEKRGEDTTTMAAPDPASVKPVAANSKLDTQLAALSADAGDFADRASRTQERIDLKERQALDKKKREEETAAKEAARPKFSLPVEQHGLSAGFGQAGGMWMSVHTGIDFPVSYGTPVMAATDGVIRTQWNSAYGNMAMVVSPDGTETWYCHLSSTKIRSGKVKAGDVIAYSGNSGNSTGPHLHFEVRPDSGSPIDPQAWLRSHGLNPN